MRGTQELEKATGQVDVESAGHLDWRGCWNSYPGVSAILVRLPDSRSLCAGRRVLSRLKTGFSQPDTVSGHKGYKAGYKAEGSLDTHVYASGAKPFQCVWENIAGMVPGIQS